MRSDLCWLAFFSSVENRRLFRFFSFSALARKHTFYENVIDMYKFNKEKHQFFECLCATCTTFTMRILCFNSASFWFPSLFVALRYLKIVHSTLFSFYFVYCGHFVRRLPPFRPRVSHLNGEPLSRSRDIQCLTARTLICDTIYDLVCVQDLIITARLLNANKHTANASIVRSPMQCRQQSFFFFFISLNQKQQRREKNHTS